MPWPGLVLIYHVGATSVVLQTVIKASHWRLWSGVQPYRCVVWQHSCRDIKPTTTLPPRYRYQGFGRLVAVKGDVLVSVALTTVAGTPQMYVLEVSGASFTHKGTRVLHHVAHS